MERLTPAHGHVCNAASIQAPAVSPGCFPLQPQHSQTNEDGYLQRPHAQKAQWCSAQTVQLDRPDLCPSSATHQCGLRQMTWPPRVAVSPAENEVSNCTYFTGLSRGFNGMICAKRLPTRLTKILPKCVPHTHEINVSF